MLPFLKQLIEEENVVLLFNEKVTNGENYIPGFVEVFERG
jgi:hypothetical protein